jgi:hypothetical protein
MGMICSIQIYIHKYSIVLDEPLLTQTICVHLVRWAFD